MEELDAADKDKDFKAKGRYTGRYLALGYALFRIVDLCSGRPHYEEGYLIQLKGVLEENGRFPQPIVTIC